MLLAPLAWAKVGDILQVIKTPGPGPTGLTFDGKYLWVTDRSQDRIYLVNPSDGLCLSSLRSYKFKNATVTKLLN